MGDKKELPACDLVLEGGVTSGLIYTGLIARLSQDYRFKSLGGTSIGAVAAAAGAIAQRAKLNSPNRNAANGLHVAFDALRDFPYKLAVTDGKKRTVLFRLFQPQEGTRRGYRIVATFLAAWSADRGLVSTLRAVWTTLLAFPVAALAGAAPGLWYLFVVPSSLLRGGGDWFGTIVAGLLAVGLGVLAAVGFAAWSTVGGMLRNHFGLCNGMEGHEPGEVLPLTLKLHELFNKLLGREIDQDPVTFGQLWWGSPEAIGGEREIDLQVITTALNLRRPYRLPNEPGTDPLRGFFYDPTEWKDLFPEKVMEWLERHRRLRDGPLVKSRDGRPLHALPEPAHWPVLVAVRLSLSFPGLLSAIPMYTLERRASDAPVDFDFVAEKIYFTDGGLTSNCPVALFDAPLPGHPTFAVRLDTFNDEIPGSQRLHLPDDTTEPPPLVKSFGGSHRASTALYFVNDLVRTALDWRDRLQRGLPGYRERILVVGLKPEEGGLNLAMPPATIHLLADLGRQAGARLAKAFVGARLDGRSNAWDRHRWLRLRSTLAAVQRYVREVEKLDVPGGVHYRDLLDLRPSIDPRLADAHATAHARAILEGMAELARGDPEVPPGDLEKNAAQPAPRLRMSSPW